MTSAQAYAAGYQSALDQIIEGVIQVAIAVWLCLKPDEPSSRPEEPARPRWKSGKPVYQMTMEEIKEENRRRREEQAAREGSPALPPPSMGGEAREGMDGSQKDPCGKRMRLELPLAEGCTLLFPGDEDECGGGEEGMGRLEEMKRKANQELYETYLRAKAEARNARTTNTGYQRRRQSTQSAG